MINAGILQDKLSALKIPGRVVNVIDNDFYYIYSVAFNPDITFNKINARIKDLEILFNNNQVELIPDNGYISIKVKKNNNLVITSSDFFRDIVSNVTNCELPVMIGADENNNRIFADLVKSPHMLIAGATGSGKSVYMHNCITSLLYGAKSELCMIDVKRVEFGLYKNVTALKSPIATDSKQAKNLLVNLCHEMDNRYQLLEKYNCRSIQELNKAGFNLNYITVVIDELADLLINNKTVEQYIIRLAQLGRASGIHLIIATQRPDSNILSGLIRANIPTRVCFAVQKSTDSRIILDCNGGEKLTGAGDGLYKPIGANNPTRFKTPYITTDNLEKIIKMFE